MGLHVVRDFLAAKTTRGRTLRAQIALWPSKVCGEDVMYWVRIITVDVAFKDLVHVVVCVAEVVSAS